MKKYTQTVIGTVLATAGLLAATSAMAGKTLDQIKQRGPVSYTHLPSPRD